MSELLFRGIWTLVATALYITQFTVSNVGFGDSATVVEQNLKLNESERSDYSGGQESTTHASPLPFTWWPFRGESIITPHLPFEIIKAVAIILLTYFGYYVSSKLKNRADGQSIDIQVKVENAFETKSKEQKVEVPKLYLQMLEDKLQFLREESAEVESNPEQKVGQFVGEHFEPPMVEVEAPNPPIRSTGSSGSHRQESQEVPGRRSTRWDEPPPVAPLRTSPIAPPRTLPTAPPIVMAEPNQENRGQASPLPYIEQVVIYDVNGIQMNAEQYRNHRMRLENERRIQENSQSQCNSGTESVNVAQNQSRPVINLQNLSTGSRAGSGSTSVDYTQQCLTLMQQMMQMQNQNANSRTKPAIDKQKAPDFKGDKEKRLQLVERVQPYSGSEYVG